MFAWSLLKTAITHPGGVPDAFQVEAFHTYETKKTGEVRVCKWCKKLKPDRTHHCSVCKMCVLKMDHHCPWVRNCIGFYNYKFFLLLIIYASALCLFMLITMAMSTFRFCREAAPLWMKITVCLGQLVILLLSNALPLFTAFHIHLVQQGYTTIEYCEKRLKLRRSKQPKDKKTGRSTSPVRLVSYNLGSWQNFILIFGENKWFWPLPLARHPHGDGIAFTPALSSRASPGLLSAERRHQPKQIDEKLE
eukprot:Skav224090  [mRNA]  locus=scaffold942:520911:521657:- [translate_table: standard]